MLYHIIASCLTLYHNISNDVMLDKMFYVTLQYMTSCKVE